MEFVHGQIVLNAVSMRNASSHIAQLANITALTCTPRNKSIYTKQNTLVNNKLVNVIKSFFQL